MTLIQRAQERLFDTVSIQSIAFFRIVFGILAFAHIFGYWIYYHLHLDIYNPDRIQFRYIGFEWLPAFHDPWMSMIMLTIAASGICVALGIYYRISSWVLAIGFLYVFLLEKATYLNHAYLFAWIAFLMPFIPADRKYSLRVRKHPQDQLDYISFWPLFVLRFLMGVVYFYGGIAKINPDWLRAVPLKQWIAGRHDAFLIGPILQQDWVPWVMAYGGLILDLSAAFLLINRRTRPWVFGFILGFHAVNAMIFQIGVFPALSITLSALFFPPDFPGKILEWARNRWKWVRRMLTPSNGSGDNTWAAPRRYNRTILVSLAILIAIHILVPLRHHLYPGDVAFTEEGHRYSWRMMLRSKAGRGDFEVRDKASGFRQTIDPSDYLWPRQRRKMLTHPDMIWQFAQDLKLEFADEYPEIEVYANIRVRLNNHPYQAYIDTSRNLAREEWPLLGRCTWILPQEEPVMLNDLLRGNR